MNREGFNLLVIEILLQPKETRYDFLNAKRKEIGYSFEAYYISLLHAYKFWLNAVNTAIERTKEKLISNNEDAYSTKISLYTYTNKYRSSLGISELKEIEEVIIKFEEKSLKSNTSKLSLNQIALIHIYQDKLISRENCHEIAQSYGFKNGDKLIQSYNSLHSTNNRIGDSGSKKKLINRKKLIESIIGLLSKSYEDQLLDEIKTIDKKIESY